MKGQLLSSALNNLLSRKALFSAIIMLCIFAGGNLAAQQTDVLLKTKPALTDNTVVVQQGGMLEISVPATTPGSTYRIQRTYPQDNAWLEVTSTGGLLKVPAFKVNAAGKQVITVSETGNGTFAQSFILDAKAGLGMKAGEQSLFSENTGGVMYAPMFTETYSTQPPLVGNDITICLGGNVILTVYGTTSGHQYRLRQTNPPFGAGEVITSTGGTIVFSSVSPTTQPYSIWTVDDMDGSFVYSFNVYAVNDPTAPIMTKNPAVTAVCAGVPVKAVWASDGSGGVAPISDIYQYRTNNGTSWSSWATYVSGTEIVTTGMTGVEIRAARDRDSGYGCNAENVYSWTVTKVTVSTSTTQTTCPSYNNGAATANPLSGTGPFTYNWTGYALGYLEFQNGWDGGIVGGVPVGFTNTGPGDADVVNTQSFTGTQSWYYKLGYGSPGAGTPFTPAVASVGAPGNGAAGNQCIIELSFKPAVMNDGSKINIHEGSVNRDDRTGSNLYFENKADGTVRLYMNRAIAAYFPLFWKL